MYPQKQKQFTALFLNPMSGFTLIELLVVISIIGLLSSVVLFSLSTARQKARVAQVVAQVKEYTKMVTLYVQDTGQYPPDCDLTCSSATDPFRNSLGVAGWNGPYGKLYDVAHPWAGHIGWQNYVCGPITVHAFVLDDDRPQTNGSDNGGIIPNSQLVDIDVKYDDGNVTTGNVQSNGGLCTAMGELSFNVPGLAP